MTGTESADATPGRGEGSGLVYILGATVIAGAIGYLIQALVPAFTSRADYVAFSVFWSAVYLVVSAISGVQQEATRAARLRHGGSGSGWPVLARFAMLAAAAFVLVVGASSPLWAPGVFGDEWVALVGALLVATGGYTLIAVLSGAYYGLRAWRAAAGMTVTDTVLRLLLVVVALLLGAGIILLGWAVALPFVLAFAVLWLLTGRRVRGGIAVDTDLRGLAVHSASTVGAALATGVMISGLPLLLGITADGLGESTLAALILVVTLTRAPLVVPLLALQSYLVVTFREDQPRARGRVLRWGAALTVLTVVLAALGAVVGPWLIDLLYDGRYVLEPAGYAAIIVSAGMTALLCLTGPAVLASGRHGEYVLGWAAASITLVAALFAADAVGATGIWPVLVPLMASPLVGVTIHLFSLRRSSDQSRRPDQEP